MSNRDTVSGYYFDRPYSVGSYMASQRDVIERVRDHFGPNANLVGGYALSYSPPRMTSAQRMSIASFYVALHMRQDEGAIASFPDQTIPLELMDGEIIELPLEVVEHPDAGDDYLTKEVVVVGIEPEVAQ